MALEAEWDHHTGKVLTLRNEGVWSSPQILGNERLPEANTEWLPVVVDYPVDYLPQFRNLLGAAMAFHLAVDGKVHQTFPDSDFSPARVRNERAISIASTAESALAQTSALILESLESGQPVPADVATHRAAIRKERDDLIATLDTRPVEDVIDMRVRFTHYIPVAQELFRKYMAQKYRNGGAA